MTLSLGSSEALAQQVAATSVARIVEAAITNGVYTALPPQNRSLAELVAADAASAPLDEQSNCLATAVYFESKGEPLQGQLAVAQVVMNRAASGRYPASWCAVVKQKAQFSFVRGGRFPRIDPDCPYWTRAKAITRIATHRLATALPADVLWYHANYVSPSWGRRLTRVERIGAHIFYRA